MSTDRVHVTRGELQLGIWPLGEVRELLASEFLLPTDDYWMAGQADWIPLSELPPEKADPLRPLVRRVGQSLRDAADTVERKAKEVIGAASEKADQQRQHVTQATERLLNDYLPRLQEPAQRALAATSQTVDAALRDEVLLRKLFGVAYDFLPRPVCRFIPEPLFVEFCLKHRSVLLKHPPAHPPDSKSGPPPARDS